MTREADEHRLKKMHSDMCWRTAYKGRRERADEFLMRLLLQERAANRAQLLSLAEEYGAELERLEGRPAVVKAELLEIVQLITNRISLCLVSSPDLELLSVIRDRAEKALSVMN